MSAAFPTAPPLVIAHRGACGNLPEHTLAAYSMAIAQGADVIEPDLVATRDGVLVVRHENAIASLHPDGSVREATTDVADHPGFAARLATKRIDGVAITGWFTEDFTLAELKTLRAKERLPHIRPANTRFDGQFEIATFDEVLRLVAQENERRAAQPGSTALGVYPETKHPSYFEGIGLPLERRLVQALQAYGYVHADSPVFVQSFETRNLRQLRGMTPVPIIQLFEATGQPWDAVVRGEARTYADMTQAASLADIATYANGIGVHTSLMMPLAGGQWAAPTPLIGQAHAAGLLVHGWTFRAENHFLPAVCRVGTEPTALGDLAAQLDAFLALGMDGFFTDHTLLGRQARDAFVARG